MPLHPLIPIAPALSFTFFASPPSTATLNAHNGSRSALLPPGVQDAPHPQALDSDGGTAGFERYTWFSIDDDLVYLSFYEDWGPLNIAMFYRFCLHVHHLMEVRGAAVDMHLRSADSDPPAERPDCASRAVHKQRAPAEGKRGASGRALQYDHRAQPRRRCLPPVQPGESQLRERGWSACAVAGFAAQRSAANSVADRT